MKAPKFETSRTRIFFGSDFHLSHKQEFIWKARGFNSIEEHTKGIIDGVNNVVDRDTDILFYLGDFSLNSTPEETKSFFRTLKCKHIYYIWGNHESNTWSIYQNALREKFAPLGIVPPEVYHFQWENVTFFGKSLMVVINGQVVVLSHFAQLIWDTMQHGAWNICGHSHSNCADLTPDANAGKILDVGVDVTLKYNQSPVISFEEVEGIMYKKKILVRDHHNKNTT